VSTPRQEIEAYLDGHDLQAELRTFEGSRQVLDFLVQSGVIRKLVLQWTRSSPYSTLPTADLEQAVSERLVRRLNQFRGGEAPEFEAWLRRVVATTAVDYWRRSSRSPDRSSEPLDLGARLAADDNIAQMLSELSSREQIVGVFRWAHRHGDHTTVTVLAEWLRLAEELGQSPSNREVAQTAGVSHPTVAAVLGRVRTYLEGDGARGSHPFT
jgi:RNA polymerase sigma factor (sigma-70 family)